MGRIVVFGATGYTGENTVRELVVRGARPVLAGRNSDRLKKLAASLGGLDIQVADVSRPASVTALVDRGDVLVSTVGPFTQWGAPAVEAAIERGAWYLDSTGEPGFIRQVFEEYGPRAAAADTGLVTAFGFDYVPGNLAGALALAGSGSYAVAVDVGYFLSGPVGLSGGTRTSLVQAFLAPNFAFRGGRLRSERAGARVAELMLADGRRRSGVSLGASEHFALPRLHPTLTDVNVMLGQHLPLMGLVPTATGAADVAMRLPGARAAASALARRVVKGSTGGPDEAARARGRAAVVGQARSASGDVLSRVQLDGPDPYDFTFRILAWGALAAADRGLHGTGALGPVEAFGLEALREGAAEAGLTEVAGSAAGSP